MLFSPKRLSVSFSLMRLSIHETFSVPRGGSGFEKGGGGKVVNVENGEGGVRRIEEEKTRKRPALCRLSSECYRVWGCVTIFQHFSSHQQVSRWKDFFLRNLSIANARIS